VPCQPAIKRNSDLSPEISQPRVREAAALSGDDGLSPGEAQTSAGGGGQGAAHVFSSRLGVLRLNSPPARGGTRGRPALRAGDGGCEGEQHPGMGRGWEGKGRGSGWVDGAGREEGGSASRLDTPAQMWAGRGRAGV